MMLRVARVLLIACGAAISSADALAATARPRRAAAMTMAADAPSASAVLRAGSAVVTPLLKPIYSVLAPLQAGKYDEAATRAAIEKDVKTSPVVVYTYDLSPFCNEVRLARPHVVVWLRDGLEMKIPSAVARAGHVAARSARRQVPRRVARQGVDPGADGAGRRRDSRRAREDDGPDFPAARLRRRQERWGALLGDTGPRSRARCRRAHPHAQESARTVDARRGPLCSPPHIKKESLNSPWCWWLPYLLW